ncbi:hypothetical protein F2Q69_00023534 [Brassica cretica]|uniref:Uncharacterized protein n=1 Tax=Brassica cretica TaxID=69181 RepID=A0A8S9Q1V5_BRACR|nr:hypothetical protein F2Q69_00023534 [Brassica cretica]
MVATLILVRDDKGNLHDQEGHLRNAAAARRRFRSRKSDKFRRITLVSINAKPRTSIDRGHPKLIDVLSWISIDNTYVIIRILQSREDHDSRGVRSKTPHPPSPINVNIDRHSNPTIDRHQETVIDRQPPAPIDRRAPITYQVQMPKIDVARLNALRPKPKPLENPPKTVKTPSDDGVDPMEVDRVPTGRTLRRRKEKVLKHLKRGANEKENESFRKRVFRIPLDKPFDEAYFAHKFAQPKPTDAEGEESVDICQGEWENDYYIPTLATHTMHTEEYDKKKSPSIDIYGSTSIDTQPHQPNHLRASTDNAYFPSIGTNIDATRDGDCSIGSWADDRYHEGYVVETAYRDQGDDELHEGFTYEEPLNMQRRDETDHNQAEAAWERTSFSHPIDRESHPSIDINH